MTVRWTSVARHYLHVVAFCCVVAVLTTLIWPRRTYLVQLGYALSVGTVTWLVIEFGRYLVDEKHCHGAGTGGHGWPRGWRGLVLTAVAIGCGFLFGSRLANLFLADGVVNSARDDQLSLTITIIAGAAASFYFHMRGKAAALSAQINAVERDATEAKLKLLETQLEPHMLFNTLANLRVLITLDPPRAVAMLDRLDRYLRMTLGGSRAPMHPLASEFDRLDDYLGLMAVRMGERLRHALDLPDDLRDLPVPPLLLQPLVENAIRHGLEPRIEGGRIDVRARREGDRLVVEVSDTGVGLDAASPSDGGGFGLAQVRERLATVYGEHGRLQVAPSHAAKGGTRATLSFPLPARH